MPAGAQAPVLQVTFQVLRGWGSLINAHSPGLRLLTGHSPRAAHVPVALFIGGGEGLMCGLEEVSAPRPLPEEHTENGDTAACPGVRLRAGPNPRS